MNEDFDEFELEDTSGIDTSAKKNTRATFMRMTKLGIAFALVLTVGFLGGVAVSAKSTSKIISVPFLNDGLSATPSPDADFTDYWKVWNVLNARFVETHGTTTPDIKKKMWGSIAGLTASYGDPYTVFFPPTEAKAFADNIAGNFGGIGAELGVTKENILTVITPLKGSPAEKAGVRAGDLVAAIDGKATDGVSVDAAVKLIRGPKGTPVSLTLIRDKKPIEVKIVRDTIEVPNIDNSYDAKTGVYYIALYQFTENSADLFNTAFKAFRESGSRKLIIDLRGNPGGYLEQARLIASHFLPKGAVVVTEDYKGKQQNVIHRSEGYGDLPPNTQVVVIVNQGSASASEILAGALQDSGIAKLVGTRSFGKGSVQELVDIDGGSLKVTVARWLTPNGRSISFEGLQADVKVERTQEDFTAGRDPQKDRAVQYLVTGQ
jgi:carboxyl-terminal processing protease